MSENYVERRTPEMAATEQEQTRLTITELRVVGEPKEGRIIMWVGGEARWVDPPNMWSYAVPIGVSR